MKIRHAALFILICALAALPALAEGTATPIPTMPVLPTPPPLMDASAAPDDLVLYYNPDGGRNYHLDPRCGTVHVQYLPLKGMFTWGEINDAPYADLRNCAFCGAPVRPEAPSATPTPVPTPVPTPTAVPVWVNGVPVEGFVRETPLNMPAGNEYYTADFAVATYRGNAFRTNAAAGTLKEAPTGLSLLWTAETGHKAGTGAGSFRWWGQPAIIKWAKEMRELSTSLTEEARNTTALREVIFASADGYIYFLNLETGEATREAIRTGYPMESAVTLHPLSYPLLIAGQDGKSLLHVRGHVGLSFYETFGSRLIRFIDGEKELPAMRAAGALDGEFNVSTLIDRNTDTAVALSSDGWLFTEKLGSRFYLAERMNDTFMDFTFPQTVAAKVSDAPVTAAMVMYGDRLWFGTTTGEIVCVNTTTMQPLWKTSYPGLLHSLAMEQDADGQLWLYAATSWLSRFPEEEEPRQLLRVNADNGETDWAVPLHLNLPDIPGGAYAPPVVGEKTLDKLVFFNVTGMAEDGSGSTLIALDKQTGAFVWAYTMTRPIIGIAHPSQTAPVAVYAPDGSGYIVMLDNDNRSTTVHLLDGLTGEELAALDMPGGNCSSPAVYGNTLVFGATALETNTGLIHAVQLTSDPVPVAEAPVFDDPLPCMAAFLNAWKAADRDAMLALCAPSWKAAQADPDKALFLLMANRVPGVYMLLYDAGTTFPVYADTGLGDTEVWHLYQLTAVEEDGHWWVMPDALATPMRVDGPPEVGSSVPLPEDK